jgi:hypothetical protein
MNHLGPGPPLSRPGREYFQNVAGELPFTANEGVGLRPLSASGFPGPRAGRRQVSARGEARRSAD